MNKKVKEKLKSACEESDKRARTEKIAHILEAVKYPSATVRAEAVISFSRSTLSESEIERIMAPGMENYNTAQVDKKGIF